MTDKYEKGKTQTAIAVKKAIPTALILTALLALLLTVFFVGGASSEKAAPDEVVKWNGQFSNLSEKTGGGIKIPAEKGDYTLRIEISSFDPSTGAALNGAVVRAPLSVL